MARLRRRPRLLVATLLALAVAGAVAAPSVADSASTRDERERVRQEAAALAAELDPLLAQDAELEAAVADLERLVAGQVAAVEAASQAIADTDLAIADTEARIDSRRAEIDGLRVRLAGLAIDAFVGDGADHGMSVLEASDVNEANRRAELLDTASSDQADTLDELRAAEAELLDLESELAEQRDEADALRAAEAEELALLEDALVEQERLEADLDARIETFQAEADALAELDAELTALLASQEAAEAAAAAAAAAATADRDDEDGGGGGGSGSGGGTVEVTAPRTPSTAAGLQWPLSGVLTSPFGPRWGRNHNGIDIAAPTGSTVVAAQSGTVVQAGSYGGYGLVVIIDHGDGFSTVYGHHSALSVSAGESVSRGEKIGEVGCTGTCTGPHSHFETRVDGVAYDPMQFLP